MSSSSASSPAAEHSDASKSLYKHFLELREDVLRHKWLKSEEAGEDVGFEAALVDWLKTHRDEDTAEGDAK